MLADEPCSLLSLQFCSNSVAEEKHEASVHFDDTACHYSRRPIQMLLSTASIFNVERCSLFLPYKWWSCTLNCRSNRSTGTFRENVRVRVNGLRLLSWQDTVPLLPPIQIQSSKYTTLPWLEQVAIRQRNSAAHGQGEIGLGVRVRDAVLL